ncbi:hypothetical protein LIER_34629 [Lithospermum erythrorhizon]|uniref:Uncharacterized protein n=1 Tax=Lithospermum erythrorhizon TaxID=34254 RepID=A0AAV3S016_LITER
MNNFRVFIRKGGLLDIGAVLYHLDMIGFVFDKRWVNKESCEDVIRTAWNTREEEVHWQAKAKVQYLKVGDKNTRFFHASTLIQRRQNKLMGLENDVGQYEEG